jgi:hypothetical protein
VLRKQVLSSSNMKLTRQAKLGVICLCLWILIVLLDLVRSISFFFFLDLAQLLSKNKDN